MRFALLLGLLVATTACSTENTCLPGNAMTNPKILDRPQAALLGARLRIGWDPGTGRGAELPRAYFAAGKVKSTDRDVGPDGPPIEETIEAVADREIVVTVRTNGLRGALRFTIEFPDRKQYISCTRGETVDQYGLRVDAEFAADGSITKSTVTEIRNGEE